MKKKIISLVIVASMMLTGVVSAANMWGSYKGNDIIRITSNGVSLKSTDVPAISYNGRTMIPINLLSQIGLNYNWDQKNKTVDILQNNTSTLMSAESIKSNVKYADFFNDLDTLGDLLSGLSTGYSLAFSEINNSNKTTQLSTMNTRLSEVINSYNNKLDIANSYVDDSVKTIFSYYYSAIDRFKDADRFLSSYSVSKSNSDFNSYLDNSSKGYDFAFSGKKLSISAYDKYIGYAINN
jgi:hypothetical protein